MKTYIQAFLGAGIFFSALFEILNSTPLNAAIGSLIGASSCVFFMWRYDRK